MECVDVHGRIGPLMDGELGPGDEADVRAHLESCAECAAAHRRQAELSARLGALPYYSASPALRAALVQRVGRGRRRWSFVTPALTAALAASLVLAVVGGGYWSRRQAQAAALDALVATHVRSLMLPGHLVDVESSDQHTVKPWFTGKIDFSPAVTDFASEGFPLLGGRLDYLEGQPAAVLVYGRRQHRINVFITRAEGGGASGDANVRGFNILRWTMGGLRYCAVSDVAAVDLHALQALLQR